MSLWGNATDLSLLTSLSYEDIQALQTTGKEQQAARSRFILSNDLERVWKHLSTLKDGRVDIVLDNSGFELVTDLVFADWLVTCTPFVSKVVFRGKTMPWFVSDVTPPDFRYTIESLLASNFFTNSTTNVTAAETAPRPSHAPRSASITGGGSGSRHRSTSRNRDIQADPRIFEQGRPLPPPAGSRSLQWNPAAESAGEERRGRSGAPPTSEEAVAKVLAHPAGSRQLQQAKDAEGDESAGGNQQHPKGSMALKLDPAYFQNARSRTISPSRSYVIDSFSSFSLQEKTARQGGDDGVDDTRGRSSEGATTDDPSSPPRLTRSTSRQRGRAGLRSFGADEDDAIPEEEADGSTTAVQNMAKRWGRYLDQGVFELSVPTTTSLVDAASDEVQKQDGFWTLPYAFGDMPAKDAGLLKELQKSDLVIFKGDLNYRKLTFDGDWPHDTPFEDALGPLKGKINLVTLRTCKADVCVGLAKGQADQVAAQDPKWQTDGKWAVVQFSPKQ